MHSQGFDSTTRALNTENLLEDASTSISRPSDSMAKRIVSVIDFECLGARLDSITLVPV